MNAPVFRARAITKVYPMGEVAVTALTAEVLSGLQEGDRVIMHPADEIREGARVTPR